MILDFGKWRFEPRTLPTLCMLVAVAVTIALGNWQTRRAAQKQAQEWRPGDAPVVIQSGSASVEQVVGRLVRARGRFLGDQTRYLDNRVHQGAAGYHVLTPLLLAEAGPGRMVLVNRGWLPVGPTRAVLPSVPVTAGTVEVEGFAALPVEKSYSLGKASGGDGPVRQHLDLEAMRAEWGPDMQPFVLLQTSRADDGLIREWSSPASRVEVHRAYALQWYATALAAGIMWLVLQTRKRKERL